MSNTGIEVFDTTIQKTNLWLKEIMEELHTEDRHMAYLALRSVLHALRDRLPKEEAIHLSAQLPLLLAGVFCDGWRFKARPYKWGKEQFFERVRSGMRFSRDPVDANRITQAVFHVLEKHISGGELEDIVYHLPKDMRTLWPSMRTTPTFQPWAGTQAAG